MPGGTERCDCGAGVQGELSIRNGNNGFLHTDIN